MHKDVCSGDEVSAWIQITPTCLAAEMQPFQKLIGVQPLSNRGGAGKGKAMNDETGWECFFLFIASSQGQTGFHGLPRPRYLSAEAKIT